MKINIDPIFVLCNFINWAKGPFSKLTNDVRIEK